MSEAECYLETIHQDPFLHTMFLSYEHASESVKLANVLDFGCGYGWGSYLLSCHNHRVTGYDPDRQRINFACQMFQKDNLSFQSDICRLTKHSYDIVCLFMVLPYVKDKVTLLNQAAAYLRPAGALWISYKSSTPSIPTFLRHWSTVHHFTSIYSDQRCLSKTTLLLEHVYCQKTE